MKVNYFIRIGDCISQLLNVIIFNGDPNYSVSGEAFRKKRIWLQKTLDTIFSVFEESHCEKAFINDINKARKLLEDTEWY